MPPTVMVPAVMPMDTVEHLDLLRREDLPPFDLHLGLLVHELELEGVQLFLLREKGCVVRLGIGEELPYFELPDADVILEVVGISLEACPDLLHFVPLFLSEVETGTELVKPVMFLKSVRTSLAGIRGCCTHHRGEANQEQDEWNEIELFHCSSIRKWYERWRMPTSLRLL